MTPGDEVHRPYVNPFWTVLISGNKLISNKGNLCNVKLKADLYYYYFYYKTEHLKEF